MKKIEGTFPKYVLKKMTTKYIKALSYNQHQELNRGRRKTWQSTEQSKNIIILKGRLTIHLDRAIILRFSRMSNYNAAAKKVSLTVFLAAMRSVWLQKSLTTLRNKLRFAERWKKNYFSDQELPRKKEKIPEEGDSDTEEEDEEPNWMNLEERSDHFVEEIQNKNQNQERISHVRNQRESIHVEGISEFL